MPLYSNMSYHYGLGSGLASSLSSIGSSYTPSYSYATPLSYAPSTSSFAPSFSSFGRPHSNAYSAPPPPLRSTFAAINRHYKPMLTTISESAYSAARRPAHHHSALTNLTRINSPKIHIHHTATQPSYSAPRPIQINTADIDVSSSRYQDRNHKSAESPPKTRTPERTQNPSNESPSDSPFMPRVDQLDPPHRSTIKRDRNIVRLSTMRTKSRSKSKSRGEIKLGLERQNSTPTTTPTSANAPFTFQHSPSPEKQNKSSWRDRFGDDLLAKPKETVRKSPGELILEKHIIRDKSRHAAAMLAVANDQRRDQHSSRRSVRRQSLSKCPTFKDICKDISADIRKGDDLNATELRQRRASLIMEDEQQILAELTTQLRRSSVEEVVEEEVEPDVVVMVRKSRRKSTKLPTRIIVHPAAVEEQMPNQLIELSADSGHEVSPPKWKAIVEHVEEDHHVHKVFKLPKKKAKAKETTDKLAPPKVGKLQRSPSGEDFWGALGTRETVYYDDRRRQQAIKELERKEIEQAALQQQFEEAEAKKVREEQLQKEAEAKAKEAEQKKRVQDMDAQFARINAMLSAKEKVADEAKKEEAVKSDVQANTFESTAKIVQPIVVVKDHKDKDIVNKNSNSISDASLIQKDKAIKVLDLPTTNIDQKSEKVKPKLEDLKAKPTPDVLKNTLIAKPAIVPTEETAISVDKPKTKKPKPLTLTDTTDAGPLSPKKLRKVKSISPDTENASPLSPTKPRKLKSKSPGDSTSDAPKSPKTPKTPSSASPKKKVLKKKPTTNTESTPIQRTDASIAQQVHVTHAQHSQQATATSSSTTDDVVTKDAAVPIKTAAPTALPQASSPTNTKPDIEKKIMKNDADMPKAAVTNSAAEKHTPTTPTTTTSASQSVATKITIVGTAAKSPETQPKVQQQQPPPPQQPTTSTAVVAAKTTFSPRTPKDSAAKNQSGTTAATDANSQEVKGPAPSAAIKEPLVVGSAESVKSPPANKTPTQSCNDDVTPSLNVVEGQRAPGVIRSVGPIVGTKKPIIAITSKMPASLKAKLKRETDQASSSQNTMTTATTATADAAPSAANQPVANPEAIQNKSSTAPTAGAGGAVLSKFTTLGILNTLPSLPTTPDRSDAATTHGGRHSGANKQQRRSTAGRSASAASRSQNAEDADSTYCLSGEESEIWSVNYSASEYTGSSSSDDDAADDMGLKPKHQRARRDRKKKQKLDNFDPKKVVKLDTKRKCYVVEEAPKYPMIATPRPLQKRWHYFSDSESESETDESETDSDSGDTDSESGTDDGCFGTVRLLPGERSGSVGPDDEVNAATTTNASAAGLLSGNGAGDGENVRMSTCSNDSGFEGGTAPASPKKMLGKL